MPERTVRTSDVTQLLRPGADGPAEAGDERQNTGVEENVQLKEKGEGFSTREACQECVLFRRNNAALLPLLQSGEYGHVRSQDQSVRSLKRHQGCLFFIGPYFVELEAFSLASFSSNSASRAAANPRKMFRSTASLLSALSLAIRSRMVPEG